MADGKPGRQEAAAIVRDAGGEIVGRTRLQKTAYLLELAGLGAGFPFEYRFYGPFSEELADSINLASAFDLVHEEEKRASWGGFYSVYSFRGDSDVSADEQRKSFAKAVARISAVELELLATAAFLAAEEGIDDPWEETRRRKPEKAADGRIKKAKVSYRNLLKLETPKLLPAIV